MVVKALDSISTRYLSSRESRIGTIHAGLDKEVLRCNLDDTSSLAAEASKRLITKKHTIRYFQVLPLTLVFYSACVGCSCGLSLHEFGTANSLLLIGSERQLNSLTAYVSSHANTSIRPTLPRPNGFEVWKWYHHTFNAQSVAEGGDYHVLIVSSFSSSPVPLSSLFGSVAFGVSSLLLLHHLHLILYHTSMHGQSNASSLHATLERYCIGFYRIKSARTRH